MKRLALLLGTLALTSVLDSRAQAQAVPQSTAIQNPLQVSRQEGNGEKEQVDPAQYVYGTVKDCEPDRMVKYEFGADFAAPVNIWEAWLGVGNTNCADVMNRQRASTTSETSVCKYLGVDKDATAKPRITIDAIQMFSRDRNATECDEQRNQTYTIYLLPLTQETNIEANMASEVQTIGLISTLKAVFTLYTLPPKPPTNVRGVTGEESIGVKFDVIEGAQAKTRYRAYFDWGTGGEGACGSGVLDDADAGVVATAQVDGGAADAGADAAMDAALDVDAATDTNAGAGDAASGDAEVAELSEPLRNKARPPDPGTPKVQSETVRSGEASLGDLDAKDIQIGDSVAVSVVTLDAADNESDLSPPICVKRIETSSFLDNCRDDPDCKGSFNTCSASPAQRTGGLMGLASLLALATALTLRRRRHV
jgi:MYXO-CTERM domain-containing protein